MTDVHEYKAGERKDNRRDDRWTVSPDQSTCEEVRRYERKHGQQENEYVVCNDVATRDRQYDSESWNQWEQQLRVEDRVAKRVEHIALKELAHMGRDRMVLPGKNPC